MLILATAAVIIASRTLVNQANRKRLQRESSKLFSRINRRFSSSFNLTDVDDEELMRTACDLERYLKARNLNCNIAAEKRL